VSQNPNLYERPSPEAIAAVDTAIRSRHSMRAFLPTPVPRETVEAILEVAARAPSGTNTQPWQVHVLTGAALARLSQRILAIHNDPAAAAQLKEEYAYYPSEWVSPYMTAAAKWAGICTACCRSARPTKPGCTPSTAATTASSTPRWA